MEARLSLHGRTVLITGAAGGIGAAGAAALHAAGANVVISDLQLAAVEAVAGRLGADRTLAITHDVTDPDACAAAVAQAIERFGSLEVVWANAGIAVDPPATIANVAPGAFERVIEVDLLGTWRTVRAALPQVTRHQGHVLVTASCYAFINGMANAAYAAAKAGVEQFGRALRAELAGSGATAGVLYPGWVATPIAGSAFDATTPAGQLVRRAFPAPLRDPVNPDRIAQAVVQGIEHRAPSIVCPRRWGAISVLRGVINPLSDRRLESDPQIQDLLAQVG